MAVTYIGSSGTFGLGANPSVTVPVGRISGDLLIIVVVGVVYPTVIATPSGWSVPAGLAVTGNSIRIFYKISGASEATVTLSTSTVTRAMMYCFRDAYVEQASGAVANAVVSAGTATTITGPRIFQQQNPAYLLQVLGIPSTVSSSTSTYAQPHLSGGGSSAGSAAGLYLSGAADTSGFPGNTTVLSPSSTVTATFTVATNLSAFTFALAPVATYSLTRSVTSVNEGSSFTITFNTNQSGSFPYTISGVTSADINGASLTGSVTNGTIITYNVTADLLLEGPETFSISLNNGLASTTVLINDTSTTVSTIPSSSIQTFTSIALTSTIETIVDNSNLTSWSTRILSNDTLGVSYPLELSVDNSNLTSWSTRVLSNDSLGIFYPLEKLVPISSVMKPFASNDIAVAYPLEKPVPISSVMKPFASNDIGVTYPLEQAIYPKDSMPFISDRAQAYDSINADFPLELSVPISAVLAPFSNNTLSISGPLEIPIFYNQLDPRSNALGFTGGSIFLNGITGIDITEPAGNLYSIGTNFTAELWVRFNDLQGPAGLLAKRADTGINPAEWIALSITSQGFIQLEVSSTSVPSGWALVLTGTQSLGKGVWYHIVVVKSGNNWSIYLNGKQYAFDTSSGTVRNTSGILSLGAYATDETYPLNGYIGGVRIVKDVAVYTSAFIPPNYEFTNTQTASQDAIPSLAIASGTVLLITPKYGINTVSDESDYSATISNTYTLSNFSPLGLNLSTKFNNVFSNMSINAPFVLSISGMGAGVGITAATTITELWI